jgi:hypothetical protein
LKTALEKTELELEKKRKEMNELEDERLRLLRREIEHEKKIGTFRELMQGTLQSMEEQVAAAFHGIHSQQEAL